MKDLIKILCICLICGFIYANESENSNSPSNEMGNKVGSSKSSLLDSESSNLEIYNLQNTDENTINIAKIEPPKVEFITNRFYYSVGLGAGWSGFEPNTNRNAGLIPLTMSFGWAFMFNDWVGLRPYVSFDIRAGGDLSDMFNLENLANGSKISAGGAANGAINLDLLINFYNTEDYYFRIGGVLGLGWAGVFGFGVDASIADGVDSKIDLSTYGSLRINTGLKMVWEQKHALELLVRIPVYNSKNTINVLDLVNKNTYREGIGFIVAYSITL